MSCCQKMILLLIMVICCIYSFNRLLKYVDHCRYSTYKKCYSLTVFYCGYLSTLLWIYRHFSANACLAPLCAMHGLAVTTVEGIGSVKNGLHPVQVRQTFGIYTCIVISLSIHPCLQHHFYGQENIFLFLNLRLSHCKIMCKILYKIMSSL